MTLPHPEPTEHDDPGPEPDLEREPQPDDDRDDESSADTSPVPGNRPLESRGVDDNGEPFDPTPFVPVFPVITAEVVPATDSQPARLLVDGQTVDIEPSADPTQAAVAEAAAAVKRRDLDYCRVVGIIDGERHRFIVSADGATFPITTDAKGAKTNKKPAATGSPSMQRTVVAFGGFALVCVLLLGGVGAIALSNLRPNAGPTTGAAAPLPPAAELPTYAPDGWTTHARWAIPVSGTAGLTAVTDANNNLVTTTDDDQLIAVNADTGQQQWSAPLTDPYRAGPWLTRIDGQTVIAVQTNQTLTWWPHTGGPTPAGQLELEPGAELVMGGTTPAVVLADQKAQIPSAAGPLNRVIPAGATISRADDITISAIDTQGQLWELATDGPHPPAPARQLQLPKGMTPETTTVTVIGSIADLTVVQLDTADDPTATNSRVALYAGNGTERFHAITGTANPDTWITTTAIGGTGNLIVDPVARRIRTVTASSWTPDTAAGDRIYGTNGATTATVGPDAKLDDSRQQTTTPVITIGASAYVTHTDSTNTTWLYALPPA